MLANQESPEMPPDFTNSSTSLFPYPANKLSRDKSTSSATTEENNHNSAQPSAGPTASPEPTTTYNSNRFVLTDIEAPLDSLSDIDDDDHVNREYLSDNVVEVDKQDKQNKADPIMSSPRSVMTSPPPTTTVTTGTPSSSSLPPSSPAQSRIKSSFQHQSSLHTTVESSGDGTVLSPKSFLLACLVVALAVLLGTTGTVLGIYNLASDNDEDGYCPHSNMNDHNSKNGDNSNSTLDAILARGYLNCGVGPEGAPGFFWKLDTAPDGYVGMEVDLCVALAAALFDGQLTMTNPTTGKEESRYRFIQVPPEHRWQWLLGKQPQEGQSQQQTTTTTRN